VTITLRGRSDVNERLRDARIAIALRRKQIYIVRLQFFPAPYSHIILTFVPV
jgi:hypothetical protein